MEKFDIEKNMKLVITIMEFMGTWPKKYPSFTYKIIGFTTVLIVTALTITTLTQALKFVTIESTSFALCCAFAAGLTVIKCFVLFFKRSHFFQMIDILKTPSFALYEKQYNIFINKKMKMCKQCSVIQIINAVSAGFLIIVSPFVGHHIEIERPTPIPFPIDIKGKPIVYGLVWLFQSIAVLLITLTVACFDGMIITLLSIAAAQLRILREQISHATDCCRSDRTKNKNSDVIVNKRLKKCIIKHLKIERYIALIEETFTYGFLIHVLVSLFITCLVGFNSLLVPLTSIDFGRCFFFFIAASMELILFCVPGNEIILQSQKIRDACYMSDWVNCGPSVRKTLFIIMEKSKRPFKLTAANFVTLSLETLISVFKSAFSYFTVLQRKYANPTK